jgi:hypothetical protein
MMRRRWALGVALAGIPFSAAFGGLDLATGHPAEAAWLGACLAGNVVSARVLHRERHRPDYARIAELEQELGLVPRKPVVPRLGGYTTGLGPSMFTAPPEQPPVNPKRLPTGTDSPPVFRSIKDYNDYLRERYGP